MHRRSALGLKSSSEQKRNILELDLALMPDYVWSGFSPVFENGRIALKGFHHTLELVKHTQNVLLWHVVHPSSTCCSFSECPFQKPHDASYFDSRLQFDILARQNRHIIANMEYLGVPVVNPGGSPRCPYDDLNIDNMYLQALLRQDRRLKLMQRLTFQALRIEKVSIPHCPQWRIGVMP